MRVMSPTSLQPQIAAMRVTPQRKAAVLLATTIAVAAAVVKAVQIMSLTAVMMINQWKRRKRKVVESWLTFWKDKNNNFIIIARFVVSLIGLWNLVITVIRASKLTYRLRIQLLLFPRTRSFPCSRYVSRHAKSRNTFASGHETNNNRFGD